jgi:hypothetical protein
LSEQPNLQGAEPRSILKVRRPPPPAPKGFFRRMPVSLRYGLPLAVIAVLMVQFWPQIRELVRGLLPSYARLQVLDHKGEPLPHVRLEFFAMDDTPFGPSPTKLLAAGEFDAGNGGVIELSREHMPEDAILRITAAGHGANFRQLRRGDERVATVKLSKPMQVPGTVFNSVSNEPLPGVRVIALGGDRRGVLLADVRTDKAGTFTIPDLSAGVKVMVVRVLHEGYGVAEKTWWQTPTHRDPTGEEKELAKLDFKLQPVAPAKGRVLLPAGVSAKGLEIRVYQLPGVSTDVKEDGSFALHHLAKEDATVFRILVANLPEQYTHPRVRVRPGQDGITVSIRKAVTVVGTVLQGDDGRPVVGALISHEHGPRGGRQARAAADGSFRLEGVPPGDIALRVTLQKSRRHPEGGVRVQQIRVGAGADQKLVTLQIW